MMPSVLSGVEKIESEDDKVVKIRMEQHNICQSAGLMGPRRRFHQTKCCDFLFLGVASAGVEQHQRMITRGIADLLLSQPFRPCCRDCANHRH